MSQSMSSTVTGKTKIKVVFLGAQSVGKSSIIEKYIHGTFEETANPTVGIDFLAKNLVHSGTKYRLQLWDTAGQERFRALIPNYLRDAHCAVVVFDVTSRLSFNETEMWVNLFNQHKTEEAFIFLVGNKIDLSFRQITKEEGMSRAATLSSPYFQISAKTGENIEDLFLRLIDSTTEAMSTSLLQPNIHKVENRQGGGAQQRDDSVKYALQSVVLKNQNNPDHRPKHKGCC